MRTASSNSTCLARRDANVRPAWLQLETEIVSDEETSIGTSIRSRGSASGVTA